MRPLYEIGSDLLNLNALLDATDGDLSRHAEGEAELTAYLERIESDQGVKLDSYLDLIDQLDMEGERAAKQESEWAGRKQYRFKRADRLRDALLQHLQRTGQKSARTASGKVVTVVANGGQAPLTVTLPPEELPAEYQSVKVTPNTAAIRKAMEGGFKPEWAKLGERGSHLRVK